MTILLDIWLVVLAWLIPVLDDFLLPAAAKKAELAFPAVSDKGWIHYLHVNEKKFAEGEVVVVDQNFGVRITALIGPDERLMNLK